MMATVFSLNQEGATFKVKVTDCMSGNAFNANLFESQKIIFYKPDGTRLPKDAILVTDTLNPSESFLQYQTGPDDSILDLREHWQYSGEIKLINQDTAETSQRFNFWVQ